MKCSARTVPSAPVPTAAAFTLIELLVVVAVIGILAGLLLPALARCKTQAQSIQCVSNLKQLSLAAQLYWDENENISFRYVNGFTNHGATYWFGWMASGSEGEREFDPTPGALYPYFQGRGVEVCPALDYYGARFKLKAQGAAYGYGYNRHLSGTKLNLVRDTSETVLFADAAQVNDFQAPASPDNPLLEEFYYVSSSPYEATAHFRHTETANVVFCDGHVGRENPVPGSIDARMPEAWVGRLRPESVRVP